MWGTIEDLKANLDKIALDVHDSDEELDSSGNEADSLTSDRRISHSLLQSKSPFRFLHANVSNDSHSSEIDGYKAEIKRLIESEAEIKELWVNYATLLKDRDDEIYRLKEEKNILTQNLKAKYIINPPIPCSSINGPNYYREIADLRGEKDKLVTLQGTSELQIKQFKSQLGYERDRLAALQLKLHEESELNGSISTELESLRVENSVASTELGKLKTELNEKSSEIARLQEHLCQKESRDVEGDVEILKKTIGILEKENINLKAIQTREKSVEIEEFDLIRQKMEKDLKETKQGKEKALHELSRLKKHLLDKESEDSEKMDEDSKIIHELRENNEHQRTHILNLERTLRHAITEKEEAQFSHENELQKSKDVINSMQKKLSNFVKAVDAKDVELFNLQAALGQYYAEIEAKDNLEKGLSLARIRLAELHEQLKDADARADAVENEKEETSAKLAQAERVTEEWRIRVVKVEEDNLKLRQALEQSMSRLNRMSMDSDYFVDRRIVIKLLVTYFQRNHSKEVLDLMVRMLGFSEEEKQRIGVSQQRAGGVVRGVIGLPGRLVGGILGTSLGEANPSIEPVNQSFSDLWVDFLLKETEEREKREKSGRDEGTNGRRPPTESHNMPAHGSSASTTSGIAFSSNRPPPVRGSGSGAHTFSLHIPRSESEFSTVPLTPSGGILGGT